MTKSYTLIAVSGDLAAGAMGYTATTVDVPEQHFDTFNEFIRIQNNLNEDFNANGMSERGLLLWAKLKDIEEIVRDTGLFATKWHYRTTWAWTEVPEQE
jgi:hypothetical protein